jgi:glycine dehydrogenase
MICDLTGFEVANASLLDESTAAAEAMMMFYHQKNKREHIANKLFVDQNTFTQTIDVIKSKADFLNIEVILGDINSHNFDATYFGAIIQNPNSNGLVSDHTSTIKTLKETHQIYTCIIADILSLALYKSPASMGADCAVGSAQRFGVPIGFGGPYAAFFATTDEFKRQIPGRIIGVSKDRRGKFALRMALQTREQHIKREKATSNICTAQALLANMAAMYAVYHGSEGVTAIAKDIQNKAYALRTAIDDSEGDALCRALLN